VTAWVVLPGLGVVWGALGSIQYHNVLNGVGHVGGSCSGLYRLAIIGTPGCTGVLGLVWVSWSLSLVSSLPDSE